MTKEVSVHRLVTLVVAVGLLLTGCGAEDAATPDATPPDVTPPATGSPQPGAGQETLMQLTGTLAGDAQLEGGCAWLEAAGGRYEVFYPEGYEVQFHPLRLVGPDGDVIAAEAEQVTVSGRVADDMVSFCQVGRIFQADEVIRVP
jgi:hypothetical protein